MLQMILDAAFIAALALLVVVPSVFIYNHVYKDGIAGRLGLAGIAFFSALCLLQIAFGDYGFAGLSLTPFTAGLTVCFSLFLTWHLFRFHRRVLYGAEDRNGEHWDRRRKEGVKAHASFH